VFEASALTAAESTYNTSVSGNVQIGNVVTMPLFVEGIGGIWVNDDNTSFNFSANGIFYREPVQGTGWAVFDEFKNRVPAYTAALNIYTLTSSSDLNGWRVGGGYKYPVGDFVLNGSLAFTGLSSDTDDYTILQPAISANWYATDNFSVGLSWLYEHLEADDGDTESDFLLHLNLAYLFEMANPLLLKVSYGQNEFNGSDAYYRNIIIGVDWIIAGDWLVGASFDRIISDDSWADWFQHVDINVGYKITESSNVSIGTTLFGDSSDSDTYSGFNVGYTQVF